MYHMADIGDMSRDMQCANVSSQDEVVAARPEIDERVTQLVSKGRWQVLGYKEKFGDLSLL